MKVLFLLFLAFSFPFPPVEAALRPRSIVPSHATVPTLTTAPARASIAARMLIRKPAPAHARPQTPDPVQDPGEAAIRKVMSDQAAAWNRGSIEDFMKGYWHSDSLQFVSKSGLNEGYTKTLNNYKKTYDNASKMGKLFFSLIKVQRLSPEYYFVTGKWLLKRSVGDIGGFYTLLFRKIGGRWVIVCDHTS